MTPEQAISTPVAEIWCKRFHPQKRTQTNEM